MKITNTAVIGDGTVFRDVFTANGLFSTTSDDGIVINGEGLFIVNGFADIHSHGFMGYHSEGTAEELSAMARQYYKRGILYFCPTIGPRSYEEYLEIIQRYKQAFSSKEHFWGLHLEGPHLSVKRCGAIDPQQIYDINLSSLEKFLKASDGYIKIMTIAPELPHALKAIKLLRQYDIIPSIGHSDANFQQTKLAVEAGASHSTHTFNAMPPLHHREPGMIDCLISSTDVFCEMVADQVHLSKLAKKILFSQKGDNQVIAVSDGGESCGFIYNEMQQLGDGYYVKNGAVMDSNGVLCGSTMDLSRCAEIMAKEYSMEMVCRIFSQNAARSLGQHIGLEVGKRANFLIVDGKYNIKNVVVDGNILN